MWVTVGDYKSLLRRQVSHGKHVGNAKAAQCERSCFIESEAINVGTLLQRRGRLDDDPLPGQSRDSTQ